MMSSSSRRVWILAAALIVALASGQSNGPPSEHEGRGHGEGHEKEHNGPPPVGRHDGQENGHGDSQHGDGLGPPACTNEQSQAGVEASLEYAQCTGLDYATFTALVHADVELLQEAATCFAEKVKDMEENSEPNEDGEIVVEVDEVFEECIEEMEKADGTTPTADTADFLNKLIGPDNKVCSCLPALVEKMPECDSWMRYRGFSMNLEDLCESVDTASGTMPGIVELETDDDSKGREGPPEGGMKNVNLHAEDEIENQKPYGPCPPGKVVHPNDPSKCHEPKEGMYQDESQGYGSGSAGGPPRPENGGGSVGFLLGVVALGGVLGVGGVWLWGKFRGDARQPGVRYIATGMDNDIGTELGPFGREGP